MTRLELAHTLLADAQWNLAGLRHRSAVSRAYYACYHAARACLERLNVAITSRNPHDAVRRLFGSRLVLPGVFPGWMGRTLNRLYDWRLQADYEAKALITGDMADLAVARAEDFLQEVKEKWDGLL